MTIDRWWGCGDLAFVFRDASKIVAPWRRASRQKRGPDPLRELDVVAGRSPVWLSEVDPRELWCSQPWVLREHAGYYLTDVWETTGVTSADRHVAANQFPIVAIDPRGRKVIRTGHHRSLAALISGRPLRCRVVPDGADEAVALLPRLLVGSSTRLDAVAVSDPDEGVARIRTGATVLCSDRTVANTIKRCLAGPR